MLVRLAQFRALAAHVSVDRALDFLAHTTPEAVADWGRVVMTSAWSVDAGHRFAPPAMGAEAAEFAELFEETTGQKLAESALVSALNGTWPGASREAQSAVISRDDWAGFYRRHVMSGAAAYYSFVKEGLGDRPRAKEISALVASRIGELRDYPLLAIRLIDGNDWDAAKRLCPDAASSLKNPPRSP
jgi:hypothetical protein